MELNQMMFNIVIIALGLAKVHSKGSPWDWQGGNARYPVFSIYPEQGPSLPPTTVLLQMNTNVSEDSGGTAHLPCRVKNLGEHTVSWLRGRDMSVLSVGHMVFSSDQRYQVVHVPRPRLEAADWNLQIRQLTFKDNGWYECQVNTEPKISNRSFLIVGDADGERRRRVQLQQSHLKQQMRDDPTAAVLLSKDLEQPTTEASSSLLPSPPLAVIPGPSVLRAHLGDTLALECHVTRLSRPPGALYWTHNGRPISSSSKQQQQQQGAAGLHKNVGSSVRPAGLSVESERLSGSSWARLEAAGLTRDDEGTYACVTDVTAPVEVELYVDVTDDSAEALASRVSSSSIPPPIDVSATILVLLMLLAL